MKSATNPFSDFVFDWKSAWGSVLLPYPLLLGVIWDLFSLLFVLRNVKEKSKGGKTVSSVLKSFKIFPIPLFKMKNITLHAFNFFHA